MRDAPAGAIGPVVPANRRGPIISCFQPLLAIISSQVLVKSTIALIAAIFSRVGMKPIWYSGVAYD